MTEDEAQAYLLLDVSRGTAEKIERYAAALREAAALQNLIAHSTLDQLWSRHLADSAQLAALGAKQGLWLDIGSGAGLPGLVIALLRDEPVILMEPRTKRAAFLAEMIDLLGLASRVSIVRSRAETAPPVDAAVISARAVAGLAGLFTMGLRHSHPSTVWVLPKGKSAVSEIALAKSSWQADIELIPSITDSQAAIIVATNVTSRSARRS